MCKTDMTAEKNIKTGNESENKRKVMKTRSIIAKQPLVKENCNYDCNLIQLKFEPTSIYAETPLRVHRNYTKCDKAPKTVF